MHTIKSRIGERDDLLSDEALKPKWLAQRLQGRADVVLFADQSVQHSANRATTTTRWADEHEGLVIFGDVGEAEPEHFEQALLRLLIAGPDFPKELLEPWCLGFGIVAK